MDQQKFFNYYTELLNRTVQDLFNKSILLQTNEKIHVEEIASLRKQLEDTKSRSEVDMEEEISKLKKDLSETQSNAETYRTELLKAKEKIAELESNS